MPDFKTATVIENTILADKFHQLTLETPEPFVYTPGQYISVKVADTKVNSYSVAGRINDRRFLLLIDTTPGGLGSQYVEKLQAGDQITYLGPFGQFTYRPNDPVDHILLVGTGCGISPLKSLVDDILMNQHVTLPVTLYFGLRFPQDIFWDDHFRKLHEDYPNFNYKICLSKADDNWPGVRGHVTDEIKKDHTTTAGYSAYVCGNPNMAAETIDIITSLGCPKDRIYSERY